MGSIKRNARHGRAGRSSMTVGISTYYEGGIVICSDTRIVDWNGTTFSQTKQSVSTFWNKHLFAVAYAGEDVPAAEMLSSEIVSAAGVAIGGSPANIDKAIKTVMCEWFQSYGQIKPPSLEFIVAHIDANEGRSEILKCQPPSTVNRSYMPTTIGCGAGVIEHHTGILAPRGSPARYYSLRTSLLRLAYFMKLAKERDGQFVGGRTEAVAISKAGSFLFIKPEEMMAAEEFAARADKVLLQFSSQMLSDDDTAEDDLSGAYAALVADRDSVKFSSLHLGPSS